MAYSKQHLDFSPDKEAMDAIWKMLVGDGKGVKKDDFHRLKCALGIQREKVKDVKRKELRIAREKKIDEAREGLRGSFTTINKDVDEADTKIVAAEECADWKRGKDQGSIALVKLANETDKAIKEARETLEAVREAVAE